MSSKNFSLSGMPDLSSLEVKRREYVFSIVKNIFEKYGFSQLETPAIEKRETLMGNYGSEGDKLVYQVLKSGDFFSKQDKKELLKSDYKTISSIISDKALRYDLTIPFARYVSKFDVVVAPAATLSVLEAYLKNINIIIFLDKDEINLSPLRGVPEVKLAYDLDTMNKAFSIQEIKNPLNKEQNLFWFDKNLTLWKKILN